MAALFGLLALACAMGASTLAAETVRLATYATELSRKGPGLLLRDILKQDRQVMAVVRVIAGARPDILLLTGIDYDHGQVTLTALAEALAAAGAAYPHRFAARPNTGMPTGLDLDGDGRSDRARDAQGYGFFAGQGGMAVLSRLPLGPVRDHSALLWRDLPGATLPTRDGAPFYPAPVTQILRLSSTAHWQVPVLLPGGGTLDLLAFSAGPPVFDGPEDRNGLRNADEIRLWQHVLDGAFGPAPDRFAILGTANLDPVDGEGRHEAIAALLADPRLVDPLPRSRGAVTLANTEQRGDPALDTVDWAEEDNGPGNQRVDYVLPSRTLRVVGSGVVWTDPSTEPVRAATEALASRHRLVWVDIAAADPP